MAVREVMVTQAESRRKDFDEYKGMRGGERKVGGERTRVMHYALVLGMVLLLLQAVGTAANSEGKIPNENAKGVPLIYGLTDEAALHRFLALCEKSPPAFEVLKAKSRLSDKCLPLEEAVCLRYWRNISYGVAGIFTMEHREVIKKCVGEKYITNVEWDGKVEKMDVEGAGAAGIDEVKRARSRKLFEENFARQAVNASKQEPMVGTFAGRSTGVGAFSSQQSYVQSLASALWNLDRIDQTQLPLDGTYAYFNGGKGVSIYMVDSGIRRTHNEFKEDGKSRVINAYDFVDNKAEAGDCDGHGTHVAGTAGGKEVGVAKDATMYAVRVLNCEGNGLISDVIAGLDWVAENHVKPAVVTLSLGIAAGGWSRALEASVQSIVDDYNILVVVASGNSKMDSCLIAPANVRSSITVGGTDLNRKFNRNLNQRGRTDTLYPWGNTGACLDIFAPGTDIYSACGGTNRCDSPGDDQYAWASGTSMAGPHVAGVAALYLSAFPNAGAQTVKRAILDASDPNRVKNSISGGNLLPKTPNRLLYSKMPGLESKSFVPTADLSVVSENIEREAFSWEWYERYIQTNFPSLDIVYANGALEEDWADWSWGSKIHFDKPIDGVMVNRVMEVELLPLGGVSLFNYRFFECRAIQLWLKPLNGTATSNIRVEVSVDNLVGLFDEPRVLTQDEEDWELLLIEIPQSTSQGTVRNRFYDRLTIKMEDYNLPASFLIREIVLMH